MNETLPMRCALNGKSPRQVYEAALQDGWQPVTVDQGQILTVFATDEVRTIAKGVISYGARNWTCSELAQYDEKRIVVCVPRFWQAERLALLHIKTRELVGIAEPIGAIPFDDPVGAQLSIHVDKARRAHIRALDRAAPSIDTVAETQRIAATILPLPTAAPIATIGLSKEAATIAERLSESPKARANRERDEDLRRQSRQSAVFSSFLKHVKGDKT